MKTEVPQQVSPLQCIQYTLGADQDSTFSKRGLLRQRRRSVGQADAPEVKRRPLGPIPRRRLPIALTSRAPPELRLKQRREASSGSAGATSLVAVVAVATVAAAAAAIAAAVVTTVVLADDPA